MEWLAHDPFATPVMPWQRSRRNAHSLFADLCPIRTPSKQLRRRFLSSRHAPRVTSITVTSLRERSEGLSAKAGERQRRDRVRSPEGIGFDIRVIGFDIRVIGFDPRIAVLPRNSASWPHGWPSCRKIRLPGPTDGRPAAEIIDLDMEIVDLDSGITDLD